MHFFFLKKKQEIDLTQLFLIHIAILKVHLKSHFNLLQHSSIILTALSFDLHAETAKS